MQDVQNLSFLEKTKKQREEFVSQRDLMQTNYQQIIGAIFACDALIKQYEEDIKNSSMATMD
jgi:hypothetical protein